MIAITVGVVLSALEAAVTAFGEVRLLAAQEEDDREGKTAARLLAEGRRLHTRTVTGRVIAIVVAVSLTVHLMRAVEPFWLTGAALAAMALVYSSLSVGVSALARVRATSWALPMARWLRPVELLVWPFAMPLALWVSFLEKRFPPPPAADDDDEHAVREVEHMIEQGEESGSISEDFAELLLSVLEFKDTVAREVMVPRTQMKAIDLETSVDEVLELIVREGHSRYPVYRDRVDQIEGILYAKDLFRELGRRREEEDRPPPKLSRIIRRPVFFVAETHKIGQLLREMQARRFHLAVVVDEFGGTSGIVTLEDIVEEIVGEIQDEHDPEEKLIEPAGEGRWWVDAKMSVYDLAKHLDIELDAEGDYDSVGGLVVDEAGRVPQEGESVEAHGLTFVVRESDERHVTRVEVRRDTPAPETDAVEAAAV